jgi:uncharacterized protein (UPF0548 family)
VKRIHAVVDRDVRWLDRLRDEPFTYSEVGATASAMPAGYHHVRRLDVIGRGSSSFRSATDALMSWEMHRRAGLLVTTSAARAVPGAVAAMRLGLGGVGIRIPCRVVYEVADERRIGFAYGTLPGHPEIGEEAFIVEFLSDERVELRIKAFSRPARWFTRLGGPVTNRAQALMTNRYVQALRSN